MDPESARQIINRTFENAYDEGRFKSFVKELFPRLEPYEKEFPAWHQFQDYIISVKIFGTYIDPSQKKIDVLAIKLQKTKSLERARVMQRNFIAKWLKKFLKDAAVVAFYGDNPEDWRFSHVKMEYLREKVGGKLKNIELPTQARRHSFLVGLNEKNHTCRKRFLEFLKTGQEIPTLEQIDEAFSVENVTKEFFKQYKERYRELQKALNIYLEKNPAAQEQFQKKNISTVDFAKKLLGQIVFIYFLQKKGWLGVEKDKGGEFKPWGEGPKNFLTKLFKKEIAPYTYENFYHDILEPLFYEVLAGERVNDYSDKFKSKIPFLDGGLFENEYDWTRLELRLDNNLFANILETFDTFNFTVKEDEPLDKDVAVDPEMLGKVFENLLEIKGRKSKGTYYTPREIVYYMCQQGLINYLVSNIDIPREDIERFVIYGTLHISIDEHPLPETVSKNFKQIDQLLREVKVVDMAVGSGAFPVGMMTELVKLRTVLTIFFDKNEQEKRSHYTLKREAIENCLYGVDIDSSAVDIARLRFWLALVVDEPSIDKIEPLPNLDHKIMCGDSLMDEFEGKKLFDERLLGEPKPDISAELQRLKGQEDELFKELGRIHTGHQKDNGQTKAINRELKKIERTQKKLLSSPQDGTQSTLEESLQIRIRESQKKFAELKNLHGQYFNAKSKKDRLECWKKIDRIEWEFIEETLKEQGGSDAWNKLQEYKKTKSKPFFLWGLHFSEVFHGGGFDIVIGNPPYIDSERMVKDQLEIRKSIQKNYKLTKGNWDIYIAFFEKGFNLLNSRGTLTLISPDKWISKPFGYELRKTLLINLQSIIKAGRDVFESSLVDSIISFFTKNEETQLNIFIFDKDRFVFKKTISKSILKDPYALDFLFSDYLDFLLSVDNKHEGNLLQLYACENACATSDAYKLKSLIAELAPKTEFDKESQLKIINTGTIGRYSSKWGKKHMTYLGKKYLAPVVNKRKFLTRFNNSYSRKAVRPKLIIKGLNLLDACLDSQGEIIPGKSTLIIPGEDIQKLKLLLGIINCKLPSIYLKERYPSYSYNQGTNYTKDMINKFPLPNISPDQQKHFIQAVDQILSITKDDDYLKNPNKQARVKRLEDEIDQLAYNLYGLTFEEIEIVKNFGKTK